MLARAKMWENMERYSVLPHDGILTYEISVQSQRIQPRCRRFEINRFEIENSASWAFCRGEFDASRVFSGRIRWVEWIHR